MTCCGLCGCSRTKGAAEETQDSQQPSNTSPGKFGHRRSGLQSIRSSTSIYYDANEELDRSGSLGQESDSDAGQKGGLKTRASLNSYHSCLEPAPHANGGGAPDVPPARRLRPLASSFKGGEKVGCIRGVGRYEVADAEGFMVRGKDYLSTKQKVQARGHFYRLVGCDAYHFEQKIYHIAQHIELPHAPKLGKKHCSLPEKQQLPPLLVINIQLPLYKAAMIPGRGKTDGEGIHLVYYFALPAGFELTDVGNEAAVGLLQRLVQDGKETNGDRTRDRLKLVARVVNGDEWAEKAPLSGYEHSLLRNYNDKPILTRPQQQFYLGKDYLEIDLDVHNYAWVARKALSGFIPRLGSIVFENALIVQGNSEEELPEVVMACARISHLNFDEVQPFPGNLQTSKSHKTTVVVHPEHTPLHAHTFPDDNIAVARSEDLESQPGRSESGSEQGATVPESAFKSRT